MSEIAEGEMPTPVTPESSKGSIVGKFKKLIDAFKKSKSPEVQSPIPAGPDVINTPPPAPSSQEPTPSNP